MTAGTSVSVEEYLRTSYEPRCEYVDGVLVPKAMGTRKHSKLQARIHDLTEKAFPHYEALPELTVGITKTEYLIPDVAVDRRDNVQDPYPLSPVHLCIEILSPEDRLSQVFAKCETYHAWGTPHTWVIDPLGRRAWQYSKGSAGAIELDSATGELCAGEIHIPLSDLFAAL
jgi:Uma2 family endonuclease